MDRPILRRWTYTSAAAAAALITFVLAVIWRIDVFDLPALSIIGIERSEAGQIAIALLLIIPAFFVDRVVTRQRRHEAQLEAERLRVLQATMRTVQDIVNNNLNQLQLLRVEAEGCVPGLTLIAFDDAIHDTAKQLTALGNLKAFVEKPMATGIGVDVTGRELPMPLRVPRKKPAA